MNAENSEELPSERGKLSLYTEFTDISSVIKDDGFDGWERCQNSSYFRQIHFQFSTSVKMH